MRRSSGAAHRWTSTPRPATAASRCSCATAGLASTHPTCRPTAAASESRSSVAWSATADARQSRAARRTGRRWSLSSPRVLIVDDHQLFRSGVRAELERHLEITGEAGTVADAISAIERDSPEVVLLDVHMPDGGGVEV